MIGSVGEESALSADDFLWGMCVLKKKRGAGCGVREGGGLMAAEFIWGMYAGVREKPMQVETFKAPQAWGAVCEAD